MRKTLESHWRSGLRSLVVVSLLSILIFFVTPHLKFGPENWAPLAPIGWRFFCIVLLLLGWGLRNLWVQDRDRTEPTDSASKRDTDVKAERPGDKLATTESNLLRLMKTLRSHSALHQRRHTLYERPWYLVAGKPGSGKTALMAQSGLGISRVAKDVGITGNVSSRWWVSDEAVFIDAAVCTALTTENDSDWSVLLDALARHRRRRPVNGVILAVDIGDLISATGDELAALAATLGLALRQAAARFSCSVPVYLVYTKMDSLPGFTDFFADTGFDQREQVWGVSLRRRDAEEIAVPGFLNGKLHALESALTARMLSRLNHETDFNRRCEILGFPRQFAKVRGAVALFARDLFKSATSGVQPCLRGIYFTAADPSVPGRAEGTAPSVVELPAITGREVTRSYFIRRLFRELILAEPDLPGFNTAHERALAWARRTAFAVVGLSFLAVGITWAATVSRHQHRVMSVQEQWGQYEQHANSAGGEDELTDLASALDILWSAVTTARGSQSHSWLSPGLEDLRVSEMALQAYNSELHRRLVPELLVLLESELEESSVEADVYEALRTYLMFEHVEHLEQDRVLQWFAAHWRNRGDKPSVQSSMTVHLQRLLELPMKSRVLDVQLVEKARASIARQPVAHRILEYIRGKPGYQTKINLIDHLGASPQIVFALEPEVRQQLQIPFFFTREGRRSFLNEMKAPQVSALVGEPWVLGPYHGDPKNDGVADFETVQREVQTLYNDEYSRIWEDVLGALSLVDLDSLHQLHALVKNLSDSHHSALWNLLRLVAAHTDQTQPLSEPAGMLRRQMAGKTEKGDEELQLDLVQTLESHKLPGTASHMWIDSEDVTSVAYRFRELNRLVNLEAGPEASAGGLSDHLDALQAWLGDINTAADPGAKAFSIAAARYGDISGNPAMALRDYAQTLPAPVRGWLEVLADESWRLVASGARQHLSSVWRTQVYEPYRRSLLGRYPLNAAAEEEIALHDFVQFFKSGGTLDQYYQDFLAPFIVTAGKWHNRTVDRQTLGIPADVLSQLQRARQVRDAFFQNQDGSVGMVLNLRPHAMDEGDVRFTLDVGDERLTYSHGPRFWTTLNWQATENRGIRVAFEDLHGRWHQYAHHGVWAWLRLLDASYIERTASQSTYLVTFTVGNHMQRSAIRHDITYEIKAQGVDNPLRRDLLTGFTLPSGF